MGAPGTSLVRALRSDWRGVPVPFALMLTVVRKILPRDVVLLRA